VEHQAKKETLHKSAKSDLHKVNPTPTLKNLNITHSNKHCTNDTVSCNKRPILVPAALVSGVVGKF
jgi:hypothetical protein